MTSKSFFLGRIVQGQAVVLTSLINCFSKSLCETADGEESAVSIQIKLENEGSDEELETDMLYSPQLALKLALTEWLSEFGVPHQYNSKINPRVFF